MSKKQLILAICVVLGLAFIAKPEILHSELVKYRINPDNSSLISGAIHNVFYDKDSTIWIEEIKGFYTKKKNETKFSYVIDSNIINFLYKESIIDKYGNIVFYQNLKGISVLNSDKKIYNFTQKDYPNVYGATGGHFIDNYMYLSYWFEGCWLMGYLIYDTLKQEWTCNKENVIKFPEELEPELTWAYVLNRKIFIPCKEGMIVYNHDTKTYRLWKDPEFEKFGSLFCLNLKNVVDEKKNVATNAYIYNARAYIYRIYGEDSVKSWKLPYKLHNNYENLDTNSYNNGSMIRYHIGLTNIDLQKEKFLFSPVGNLIYWSEKEGFKYIPPPAQTEIDSNAWLYRNCFFLKDSGEIWLSSWGWAIYALDIKELISRRTDDFPYKDSSDATTEDLIPGVPVMSIYKVQPQPAKDYVDCSYFVQEGKFGDISVKIFDAAGKEYKSDKYEIIAELGVSKTLRVYAKGLPAGTYIIQIQDGANTASEKLIKE